MKIQNKIKKYRLARELKQAKVAKYLKISERHFRALEAGTSDGSIKLWKQLADFFDTTIDDLLKQDDTELLSPASKNSSEILN